MALGSPTRLASTILAFRTALFVRYSNAEAERLFKTSPSVLTTIKSTPNPDGSSVDAVGFEEEAIMDECSVVAARLAEEQSFWDESLNPRPTDLKLKLQAIAGGEYM